MRIKANITLFIVALIWGTGFISQGIAGRFHVAYLFNGVSFILASIILIPFIPQGQKFNREKLMWMSIAGVILFFATALQQVGILFTKVANAGFLTSLYFVFTPFLLWVGFHERPHWMDLVAVIAAIIGAYFLSTAGKGFQFQQGDSLEVIGAVFWGMHFVVLGKFAARFEPISFASGHFFITGILNFIMGLIFERLSLLTPLIFNRHNTLPFIPFHRNWIYITGLGAETYFSHRRSSYSWAGSRICRFRCLADPETKFITHSNYRLWDYFSSGDVFPDKTPNSDQTMNL